MQDLRYQSTKRILSVIIPVRNGAGTIGRLLGKLLRQQQPTGWETEIVVGYQQSSDDTLSILEQYHQNAAVKVVPCAGEGPSANRNAAVQQSRGELLYFIDADAVPIEDEFFVRLIDAAGQCEESGKRPADKIPARSASEESVSPGASLALRAGLCGNPRTMGLRSRRLGAHLSDDGLGVPSYGMSPAPAPTKPGVSRSFSFGGLGGPILIDPAQRNNPVALADHYACWFDWHAHRRSGESFFQPTVHLLVPRAVFDAVGGFDERLRVLEDFDFECRIKDLGLKIYFDQTVPIAHEARGSLFNSWRHSWYWGRPAREQFYQRVDHSYRFADRPRLFWLNLPRLYWRRLHVVAAAAAAHSKWRAFYCLPFLAATVFAWALAAAVGRTQPPADSQHEKKRRAAA
ncbi:MAG TPA: glycosyltransferase [Pirellulales bacterium]|nr:glycosyltransferase [Pirellulales bacterium]